MILDYLRFVAIAEERANVLNFRMHGGEGEIRTHGGVTPTPVFKCGAGSRNSANLRSNSKFCDSDCARNFTASEN